MKKFQEYLIDSFREELNDALVLCGIPVGDTKDDAEQNKLSGFIPIDKILPFVKKCQEVQLHILDELSVDKEEGKKMDAEIEDTLPPIFKQSTREREEKLKKEKEEKLASLGEFEDLDENIQNEILQDATRCYESDIDRFQRQPFLIRTRHNIKMDKEKLTSLVIKKLSGGNQEPNP